MLKKLTFKKDYRCFDRGDVIPFEPLTLLVGDQGSGKSTIFQLLSSAGSKATDEIVKITADKIATKSFDYEKDNPRTKSYIETAIDVQCRFVSHGQLVRQFNQTLCEEKGICFIMDEPDSCLSIRSCIALANAMKTALKNGCQVVATIHSPIVMEQFDKVYSLEHRMWCVPKAFIDLHLK